MKMELDHYLEEEVLPRSSDFDILMWWKLNELKYPTLQAIARDLLAIPISTVASKLTSSIGGQILTPHHSRLHYTTLEALALSYPNFIWGQLFIDMRIIAGHVELLKANCRAIHKIS